MVRTAPLAQAGDVVVLGSAHGAAGSSWIRQTPSPARPPPGGPLLPVPAPAGEPVEETPGERRTVSP
ncbi:hypothetical protein GCM10011583_24580 [Streptomyces camponoticapitis]|uniref:Uncharacterized protein n=1 Tax=Streptomyces camponoticapitis TaxID=1616125 RepID=A0ABQ2E377_9ACTN|nr:hypothetical protein GCM10011583_24580 [Streptomyces camponoticapitis]